MSDLDEDTAWLDAVSPLGIIDKQQMSSAKFWVGSDGRRKLQEMLGWTVTPPFIGYVDGRHPRRLLENMR